MRADLSPFPIIKQNLPAYLILNAAFYGLLILMMILATIFPELKTFAQGVTDPNSDPLNYLFVATYGEGRVLAAAAITFAVNVLIGVVITQTIPSLVIPFFGVVFAFIRVAGWGMVFAPTSMDDLAWFIPHMLTAILEGQAYVLAALAAWIQGRKFLSPQRYELASRLSGYRAGVADTALLYPLIIVTLAVAAVWEAIELIHIVPDAFLQWWLGH